MDKKSNLIIIICIFILLLITSGVAIFLSMRNPEEDNPSIDEPKINKSISRLTEENQIFGVQKVINDFYMHLANRDNNAVYNLLDSEYREQHNITLDNVITMLNQSFDSTYFTLEEAYYNPNSDITYYFVHGYLINAPAEMGTIKYDANKNFLIIVGLNNNYIIKPLSDDINISNYAKNYSITNIDISSGYKYTESSISERNKIIFYITSFTELLYTDSEKAYNMLDEATKNKYVTIDDFKNNLDNIYNSLFVEFRTLNKNELNDRTIYEVINNDIGTITITEFYPMDYKIGV